MRRFFEDYFESIIIITVIAALIVLVGYNEYHKYHDAKAKEATEQVKVFYDKNPERARNILFFEIKPGVTTQEEVFKKFGYPHSSTTEYTPDKTTYHYDYLFTVEGSEYKLTFDVVNNIVVHASKQISDK